ncbi:hypothetical protein NQZ68_022457 [Dissostichus eleginoides]|nr:hypothetical protein NQZ68_022457 [Dissostichus eleginoides]
MIQQGAAEPYRLSQCRAADRQQGAAEPLQALTVQSCRQTAGGSRALQALTVQSCRQTAGGSRATTGSHSTELQTDSRGQQSHDRLSQYRAADRQQGSAEPLQALTVQSCRQTAGGSSALQALTVQSCRQTAGGSRATTGSDSAELQTDSRGQQSH